MNSQKTLNGLTLQQSPALWFYSILIVGFLYRLFVLCMPHLNLYYDEIYYYHWSLNPDFGYYSKPPMIGWLIGLFTYIGGHTELAIKLGSLVAWTISSWVVYQIARYLWGATAAMASGLLFASMPLVGFYSLFMTTDSVLLLFWSLTLWFVIQAVDRNVLWCWLLAGFFAGCGMLSKYTFVLLPAALLGFLLAEKQYRSLLATPGPWLAAAIALLLFGLNVFWNFQNHWVSWRHTAEISQLSENWLHPIKLLEFLVTQLLLIGLVTAFVVLRFGKQLLSLLKEQPLARLLVWVGGGLLLVIATQALLSRAFANWAAPALISLLLLAAYLFKERPRWLIAALLVNWSLLITFYHYPQILSGLGVESTKKNDPFVRLQQWDQLAARIKPVIEPFPEAKLASDSRKYLAYFGFYLFPQSDDFAYWNPEPENIRNYYDLRGNFSRIIGDGEHPDAQEYLFLTGNSSPDRLHKTFTEVKLLETIPDYHRAFPGKQLSIYWVRGFTGYDAVVESQ